MHVTGIGEFQIEMLVNVLWKPFNLIKVWYVPESDENLFSSSAALDNGLYEYDDNKVRELRNKNYSKYRTVYLIKEKSQMKEMLARFLAEVKTANYTLKELLTNGGGEFINSEVLNIVQKAGLNYRTSMLYTPVQSGVIERKQSSC